MSFSQSMVYHRYWVTEWRGYGVKSIQVEWVNCIRRNLLVVLKTMLLVGFLTGLLLVLELLQPLPETGWLFRFLVQPPTPRSSNPGTPRIATPPIIRRSLSATSTTTNHSQPSYANACFSSYTHFIDCCSSSTPVMVPNQWLSYASLIITNHLFHVQVSGCLARMARMAQLTVILPW